MIEINQTASGLWVLFFARSVIGAYATRDRAVQVAREFGYGA